MIVAISFTFIQQGFVRQPLAAIAEITQGCPLVAAAGKLMQHWDDALAVMGICRRDVDRQREAVLIHREMDFDALDLLAAIEAAAEATRRRLTGAAVDDDGAGIGSVAASLPPSLDQAVEQPAPQAKPGPPGEQGVERAERNVAQLANGAPLHAAKADTPNRHDRLAQRRSGQRRLRPATCRPGASAAMAASSASTASTKASTSLKASHEAGDVLAGLKAVPICCGPMAVGDGRRHSPSPSRASALIHLKVASRSAPAGTPRLQTVSEWSDPCPRNAARKRA